MSEAGSYASGNWSVAAGNEVEFISRRKEFTEKLGACRELCDDFRGGTFFSVVSIS